MKNLMLNHNLYCIFKKYFIGVKYVSLNTSQGPKYRENLFCFFCHRHTGAGIIKNFDNQVFFMKNSNYKVF